MLIVNIVYIILNLFFVGYIFNRIKGIKKKGTYLIVVISFIISAIMTNKANEYNSIVVLYIIKSCMFHCLYCLFNKYKIQIASILLPLNIILIGSTLTIIPILILGYNLYSLILNCFILITIIALFKIINFNKYYNNIIRCWNRNREKPNKISSVTFRNTIIIFMYILISITNIFVTYRLNKIYIDML